MTSGCMILRPFDGPVYKSLLIQCRLWRRLRQWQHLQASRLQELEEWLRRGGLDTFQSFMKVRTLSYTLRAHCSLHGNSLEKLLLQANLYVSAALMGLGG